MAQVHSQLAQCPNVYVKLGGLGMRLFGFDVHKGELPPSSQQLADAWRPYIETCIEAFGADARDVREQLPGRQRQLQLPGAVECVQADRRGRLARRQARSVQWDRDACLPTRRWPGEWRITLNGKIARNDAPCRRRRDHQKKRCGEPHRRVGNVSMDHPRQRPSRAATRHRRLHLLCA